MNIKNKLCLLLIAVFLTSCVKKGGKQNSAIQENENLVVISDTSLALMDVPLIKPAYQQIESSIFLAGKVTAVPNNRAAVSSDIEGKVERIFVLEGNYVKKGAPLMTLRSMALIELQNQYLEAKSQCDFLELDYKRQKELINNRVGALVDFQNTTAKYEASQAKVNALRAKLQVLGFSKAVLDSAKIATHLTIYSPIAGYVFELPVQIGALAMAETKLAEIVNNDQLMADVFVYDKDLDNVVEGQKVEIDFIAHSYPSVPGTITHISRAIDLQTKAVTVHVKFNAPPQKLVLPEMSIRCVVINNESLKPKLAVPRSAILEEADHSFVYVNFTDSAQLAQRSLYKYRVIKGNQNEEWVQITFANEPKGDYRVVSKNVMIVESERKKRAGMML